MKTYLILAFLTVMIITGCKDPALLEPNKRLIPDKTQYIYFTMNNSEIPAFNDIYRLNIRDSSDCRLLVKFGSLWGAPASNRMVYAKWDSVSKGYYLAYCSLDSINETVLFLCPNNPLPWISPNGNDVIYFDQHVGQVTLLDMNRIELNSGNITRYGRENYIGAFSRDGSRLATEAYDTSYLVKIIHFDNYSIDSLARRNMSGFDGIDYQAENMDWSPDGIHLTICYSSYNFDLTYTSRLIIYDIINNVFAILDEDKNGLVVPKYSPDGTKIAYINSAMKVCVIDANGLNKKELASTGLQYPNYGQNLLWHPDGQHVIFMKKGTIKTEINIVDIVTGDVRILFSPPGNLNMREMRMYFAR